MNGLKPLVLSLAMALSAPLFANIDMPPGVAWQAAAQDSDIDAIFKQASTEKKPVLLYWGAKWCPPCNQLKATLFNRADFIGQAKGVLPVLIDGDLPGAQKLGTRFKVRGYPTLILFSPQGAEISRLPGEADAAQVVKLLQLGLAGGRPVAQVLRDARAGKALKPSEWQLLGYYSWETDQDQLVKESERAALMRQLAQAPGVPAEVRTRLLLKGLAAAGDKAAPLTSEQLSTVMAVLTQSAAARAHADVLSNQAVELVRALQPQPGEARERVRTQLDGQLASLQSSTALSRADRVGALLARVELARMDEPKTALQPKMPAPLLTEVRGLANSVERDIKDAYERQSVVYSTAHLLGQAGLWADSDALLKRNLSKSHSPYYLMSMLGSNARKNGRNAEALDWYAQSFSTSKGPATRLQWGAGYFRQLVELAPQDSTRIEQVAAQLISEAAQDKGSFHERSARSLQRVADALLPWASGANAPVLGRLQQQLDGVCKNLNGPERASCDGLLKPKSKAA
jgi:thioredoxin-related protein